MLMLNSELTGSFFIHSFMIRLAVFSARSSCRNISRWLRGELWRRFICAGSFGVALGCVVVSRVRDTRFLSRGIHAWPLGPRERSFGRVLRAK